MPKLGCPTIYGVSNNDSPWWGNREVAYLGLKPKASAEAFRRKLEAERKRLPADDPEAIYQGGMFTADGIHKK